MIEEEGCAAKVGLAAITCSFSCLPQKLEHEMHFCNKIRFFNNRSKEEGCAAKVCLAAITYSFACLPQKLEHKMRFCNKIVFSTIGAKKKVVPQKSSFEYVATKILSVWKINKLCCNKKAFPHTGAFLQQNKVFQQ
jgi:hypothetical protein